MKSKLSLFSELAEMHANKKEADRYCKKECLCEKIIQKKTFLSLKGNTFFPIGTSCGDVCA